MNCPNSQRIKLQRVILVCVWIFFAASNSFGQTKPKGILIPIPADLSIYYEQGTKLSDRDIWQIRIHGIRLTPLDPKVWSPLRIDRTNNRHLIPIRRFFLRESEDPNFKLTSIAAQFRFKPVSAKSMDKSPHALDPVFEIGFGARYSNPELSSSPPEDSGYALRLSGFEPVKSGLFHYSKAHYEALSNIELPALDTKATYNLLIEFVGDKVQVKLNDKEVASHDANNIASGLVSLQSSWHPVFIDTLEVKGERNKDTKETVLSGLVRAPEFERRDIK